MSFSRQQKDQAKVLEAIAKIYKNQNIGNSRYKDQFSEENGYLALKIFIDTYAYERQGAASAYHKIALECLSQRYNGGKTWSIPSEKDADEIWENYKKLARDKYNLLETTGKNKGNIKVNPKRNPLNSEKGIITKMHEKKINNLALYVLDKLKNKKIKEIYDFFRTQVKGIGEKITSFYIRDIADKALQEKLISSTSI